LLTFRNSFEKLIFNRLFSNDKDKILVFLGIIGLKFLGKFSLFSLSIVKLEMRYLI